MNYIKNNLSWYILDFVHWIDLLNLIYNTFLPRILDAEKQCKSFLLWHVYWLFGRWQLSNVTQYNISKTRLPRRSKLFIWESLFTTFLPTPNEFMSLLNIFVIDSLKMEWNICQSQMLAQTIQYWWHLYTILWCAQYF